MNTSIPIEYDPSGTAFQEVCERGAKDFSYMWLVANQSAINAAEYMVDPSKAPTKQLVSKIVLNVLYGLKKGGYLVDNP